MILWLDHKIFGNGYGLKSPYFDDIYYWLGGEIYTWFGGLGAQLTSFQWRHPKPGERRTIAGRVFTPFQSDRYFLWIGRNRWWSIPVPIARVRVSWATPLPEGLDEAHALLREVQSRLGRL